MNNIADDARTGPPSMRPFFIVWTGQAFSLLGSQLVQFALIWWLTNTTHSATVLAFGALVGLLPQVTVAPFAGALVDRWNRRVVMICADAGIALATLLLAVLYALGVVQFWHIYVLMFVRSVGAAFHWPAMQASTTLMVEGKHLARVAGLNQTLGGLANILVPPLGALLIAVLPMPGILAIDVATAMLAIGPLLFIAIPQPARREVPGGKRSVLGEMREGLRFVLGWKGLVLFSILGIMINLLGRAAGSLSPILVTRRLGGGVLELGLFQSAAGIGAVLGGVVLGVWGGFRRRMATAMGALALDGVAIVIIALTPPGAFSLVLAMVLASGLLETMCIGLSGAIGQAIIPPEMQGRAFSLLSAAAQIAAPLGLAVAGPVTDMVGVQTWWLFTGVMITLMGAGAFLVPEIMGLEAGRGKEAQVAGLRL